MPLHQWPKSSLPTNVALAMASSKHLLLVTDFHQLPFAALAVHPAIGTRELAPDTKLLFVLSLIHGVPVADV